MVCDERKDRDEMARSAETACDQTKPTTNNPHSTRVMSRRLHAVESSCIAAAFSACDGTRARHAAVIRAWALRCLPYECGNQVNQCSIRAA